HHGSEPFGRENLEQDRVGDAAVDDVGLGYAAADRAQACLHLGDHAGLQAGQELGQVVGGDLGQQAGPVGPVGVEALDVGEDDQLLGVEGDGQGGGGGVGGDVVHHAVGVGGDRGEH